MLMATTNFVGVAGVFGVGLVIGLVVLMMAEETLMVVAKTAARDIAGSFWAGLLWQLLAVPLLAALVIAFAITIIGILALPVVVLAWALAYCGAFTLGVLAVALVVGRALAGRGSSGTERAVALRSLTVGLVALSTAWFAAALIGGIPVAGALARLVAVAITWAVATVGLGAVVKSRVGMSTFSVRLGARFAGTRRGGTRRGGSAASATAEAAVPSWQTPTPVQGVVAARRPTESTTGIGPGAEL